MILKGNALHRSEAEIAGSPPADTGPGEFDFRSHRPAHPLGRLIESMPPSRYLAAQRAAFSADEIDDAEGFVPER